MINEFSSKIVILAGNGPKMLKINSTWLKHHFESLSEEMDEKGLYSPMASVPEVK